MLSRPCEPATLIVLAQGGPAGSCPTTCRLGNCRRCAIGRRASGRRSRRAGRRLGGALHPGEESLEMPAPAVASRNARPSSALVSDRAARSSRRRTWRAAHPSPPLSEKRSPTSFFGRGFTDDLLPARTEGKPRRSATAMILGAAVLGVGESTDSGREHHSLLSCRAVFVARGGP